MKVICIMNKKRYWGLTVEKWYHVINEDVFYYEIVDDLGYKNWYPKRLFKTQREVRREKLELLSEC